MLCHSQKWAFRVFWPLTSRLASRSAAANARDEHELHVRTLRARLLYQSKKRGILENDILIGGFAEQHLGDMDEHELEQYDQIINGSHMEWDLFYYIAGRKEVPEELEQNEMFRRMRAHIEEAKRPIKIEKQ